MRNKILNVNKDLRFKSPINQLNSNEFNNKSYQNIDKKRGLTKGKGNIIFPNQNVYRNYIDNKKIILNSNYNNYNYRNNKILPSESKSNNNNNYNYIYKGNINKNNIYGSLSNELNYKNNYQLDKSYNPKSKESSVDKYSNSISNKGYKTSNNNFKKILFSTPSHTLSNNEDSSQTKSSMIYKGNLSISNKTHKAGSLFNNYKYLLKTPLIDQLITLNSNLNNS